jgi:pyruvate-formate lyase-activating enzyme
MSEAVVETQVLRSTSGRCSTCLKEVPASVVVDANEARLEKHCPEHGLTTQLLSHAPEYWRDLDRYYFLVNGENYRQRDFIVRMTERCNLACPICLAKANTEDTPDLDLSGLEKLLSERRGIKLDLMAAEPTIRKDLEEWVRRVKATGNIAALHTNGIRLADPAFARRMKDCGVDEVFLQFDGFDDEANTVLRGRPVLETRLAALRNLREVGLATSLIVVIARGLNEEQVGRTFEFALQPENDHIREVFFLGLRVLGSARDDMRGGQGRFTGMDMMPDETLDLLCAQQPAIRRDDVRRFNKLYFALISAFKVKKCLYVQHYLVARDGRGGYRSFADLSNLSALEEAAETYARDRLGWPRVARARFLAALGRQCLTPGMARLVGDFARMQLLLKAGMNLGKVPRRMLILGFITACDPQNFDAAVAVNCGKGELSVDVGFQESGAVANVTREARFDATNRRPGHARG